MLRYVTKADAAIIVLLTLLSITGFGMVKAAGVEGGHAVIEVSGEKEAELSMNRDGTAVVRGPLGETVVAVKNGEVSIVSSPCPRGFCMHMGSIRYPGEILVCVPNRVCVSIHGGNNDGTFFDGIVE